MICLQVEHLEIHLGEFHLQDISFSLKRGEYLTIIGPTGAGKTILLESIIGFWKVNRGRISLEGRDITEELPEKRRIGIVYQDYALLPHFSVFDNIAYGMKKKERDKARLRERVGEMAAALNIDHLLHRKPSTLSGGEQQRVALARALIVEPKLLLMDEPLSALDRQTRREMRSLLRQVMQERQTTVIHITHDLNDAWALADKVAIFQQGRLLQFGSQEEVFHCPNSQFVADFVGATVLAGVVDAHAGDLCQINVNGFQLNTLDMADVGKQVKLAIRPENIHLTTEKPSCDIRHQSVVETRLEEIVHEGKTSTVLLRSGETRFDTLVTNTAVAHGRLQTGDVLYAVFHAAHVRIISEASARDCDA